MTRNNLSSPPLQKLEIIMTLIVIIEMICINSNNRNDLYYTRNITFRVMLGL